MKPRLYLLFGIWHCVVDGEVLTGYGYTPAAAFDEWLRVAWDAAQKTDAAAVSAVNN